MTDAASSLVVNLADIPMVPVPGEYQGTRLGAALVQGRGASCSMNCLAKIVSPGARASIMNPTHWAEEVAFILGGTGEYHADGAVYPVRKGDFLLAPEGRTGARFEVANTGSENLTFIAFESRHHDQDLKRRSRARAVIEAFLELRKPGPLWHARYTFDGRVLTAFYERMRGSPTVLLTYDQVGTIWINGKPLREEPGESIEVSAGKLMKAEEALLVEAYRAPAELSG